MCEVEGLNRCYVMGIGVTRCHVVIGMIGVRRMHGIGVGECYWVFDRCLMRVFIVGINVGVGVLWW